MGRSIHFVCLLAGTSLLPLSGCTGTPDPVGLVVFLDSSASFSPHRDAGLSLVRALNERLEPDVDSVFAFRVAGEVDWLYNGLRPNNKRLSEALEPYVKVQQNDRGTAYGSALTRGLDEIRGISAKHKHAALVFIGDGHDEKSQKDANIDWESIPPKFRTLPPNAKFFFLFLDPQTGDRYREAFKPILGDRFEPFTPETSRDGTAKKKILEFLER